MPSLDEVMTRDVYTTTSETTVSDVADAMVRGRFGSALVLESGWLAGIFTERDALRAVASGEDLASSPVSRWMTRDPRTVTADMEVADAAQLMAENGFRHLPVVDGKELLGIVSLRDVLATRIARAPR
jgi:CBS domain-containing protein